MRCKHDIRFSPSIVRMISRSQVATTARIVSMSLLVGLMPAPPDAG
jgi:hypothetical protein